MCRRTMDCVFRKISEFLQELPEYHTFFENAFRTQCATAPVGEILACTITHETLHNSIRVALQQTAAAMHDAARTPQSAETSATLTVAAHQLGSPLLAQVIDVVYSSLQTKVDPPSLSRRPREDATLRSAPAPMAEPARRNIATLQTEASKEDPLQIRASILSTFDDIPIIYQTCPKLECRTERCDTCRTAFKRLNLSKCTGHRPCHPTGWYAHLSPSLVHGLNKVHRGEQELRLASRAPGRGEIASPWEVPLDWAEEMVQPDSPLTPPPSQAMSRGRGRGQAGKGGAARSSTQPPTLRRTSRNRAPKRRRPNPPDAALRNMRLSSPGQQAG